MPWLKRICRKIRCWSPSWSFCKSYIWTRRKRDLTQDQQQAYDAVKNKIDNEEARTFLLHGVTGSGKTEIYLQTIETVLNKGKEAMMLVPEIALTPQMVLRFKRRFGDDVAVLHSGLSNGNVMMNGRKFEMVVLVWVLVRVQVCLHLLKFRNHHYWWRTRIYI